MSPYYTLSGGAGEIPTSPATHLERFMQEQKHMELNLEQCPLCGTELSQTKYREIKAKLRNEQEHKEAEIAEAKAAAKRATQEELKLHFEEQRRILEKKIRGESEQTTKKALADVEQLANRLKAAEEREANIRKEAQAEIERQKQTAAKKAKDVAEKEAEARIKKLAAERDQATKQLTQFKERESDMRKQLEQQADRKLEDQRHALERDKTTALLRQQADFNRERESLQKKTSILQQQLDKRTANDLGDSGEINVFDDLRERYQGEDKLRRVSKGENGADILQQVMYKGECCGLIVIENKNRKDWKDAYATKLRQDQMEARAEHGVLVTRTFPAGKKHLCFESGVIVVAPHLVAYIVDLLRKAMIESHKRGLSQEQRASKMGQLYALITSDLYTTRFARVSQLIEDALEVDVQEQAQHNKTRPLVKADAKRLERNRYGRWKHCRRA